MNHWFPTTNSWLRGRKSFLPVQICRFRAHVKLWSQHHIPLHDVFEPTKTSNKHMGKTTPSRQKSGFKHLYFKRLGLPWFPNPLFPSPTLWGAPNPKAIGGANPGGWKKHPFFSAVKIVCAQFCTIIRFNIHIYIYICVTVIHYIYI